MEMTVAEWIVDAASHALAFPKVQHRHPNGIIDAVRDRTHDVVQAVPRRERWTFACACGAVFVWERTGTITGPAG